MAAAESPACGRAETGKLVTEMSTAGRPSSGVTFSIFFYVYTTESLAIALYVTGGTLTGLVRAQDPFVAVADTVSSASTIKSSGTLMTLTGAIAARYGIGYAPDGSPLKQVFADYTADALAASGLVIDVERGRYDRFRDRIMFPIRNIKGQIIGFGGRVLDKGEPKYLNSPETPLFHKGSELYGLFEARAYYEKVDHFMDFGPDKRFWYGPGAPPAGSGGDTAVNGVPCSPISGTRMVNGASSTPV